MNIEEKDVNENSQHKENIELTSSKVQRLVKSSKSSRLSMLLYAGRMHDGSSTRLVRE